MDRQAAGFTVYKGRANWAAGRGPYGPDSKVAWRGATGAEADKGRQAGTGTPVAAGGGRARRGYRGKQGRDKRTKIAC